MADATGSMDGRNVRHDGLRGIRQLRVILEDSEAARRYKRARLLGCIPSLTPLQLHGPATRELASRGELNFWNFWNFWEMIQLHRPGSLSACNNGS